MKQLHFIPGKDIKKMFGEANAKVSGTISESEGKLKHDIETKISVRRGKIKDLGINEFISDYASNIPSFAAKWKKAKEPLSDRFELLTLEARLRETQYRIVEVKFIGRKKRIQIKGRGRLFPAGEDTISVALLTLKGQGRREFPIRLAGPKFSLSPDYNYTNKKLSKKK